MVRMQDVADRADVSVATVSFVVNGTKRVSERTRQRVETAMSELGFTRNVLARALATKRSRIIALLFPQIGTRATSSAMEFVHGASVAAAERDHHLVLWPVANDPEALREYLDGGLVDGVIAMEVQLEDPRVPVLQQTDTPFVLIGRTADTSGYGFADIDFEADVAVAVQRLRDLGHRRIALVHEMPDVLGESAYGPLPRIEQVYRTMMLDADERPVVALVGHEPSDGVRAAADLLDADPGVTAVVVMNDDAAPGLLRGLRAAGREVPAQVSVIGLAMGTRAASFCDPPLDHLAPPGSELGRAAAVALIDRLEDASTPQIKTLLPCIPHPGESLAPPPPAEVPRPHR